MKNSQLLSDKFEKIFRMKDLLFSNTMAQLEFE